MAGLGRPLGLGSSYGNSCSLSIRYAPHISAPPPFLRHHPGGRERLEGTQLLDCSRENVFTPLIVCQRPRDSADMQISNARRSFATKKQAASLQKLEEITCWPKKSERFFDLEFDLEFDRVLLRSGTMTLSGTWAKASLQWSRRRATRCRLDPAAAQLLRLSLKSGQFKISRYLGYFTF